MTVSHHLTDETILDYSAGSLIMSMETLIACHLTVCSHCRLRAELADGIGGGLLDDFESVPVSASPGDLIARAGSMADRDAPGSGHSLDSGQSGGLAESGEDDHRADTAGESATLISGVPRPLARLLPAPLEDLPWRRIAPGIRRHNLSNQPRRHGAFQLLRLEPGVVLSAHSHADRELTFLVKGSYVDEIGHFKEGDIADLDGHHDAHRPVVDSDVPCIALIATQSPVRFTGLVGKIMQPFVGI
ncbi:MAG: transcriptional regulator [Granulosicoccus sp.]|nr:transcriptional regulator [Granulosicoccus sp.]